VGTGIKHSVPDRVKPSFVIFNTRALWRSWLSMTSDKSTINTATISRVCVQGVSEKRPVDDTNINQSINHILLTCPKQQTAAKRTTDDKMSMAISRYCGWHSTNFFVFTAQYFFITCHVCFSQLHAIVFKKKIRWFYCESNWIIEWLQYILKENRRLKLFHCFWIYRRRYTRYTCIWCCS